MRFPHLRTLLLILVGFVAILPYLTLMLVATIIAAAIDLTEHGWERLCKWEEEKH